MSVAIDLPPSYQIQLIQLFENPSLNHLKPTLAHQREPLSDGYLAERQLSFDHLIHVSVEHTGAEAWEKNGSSHFVLVLEGYGYLGEVLSIVFDGAEVFIDPDDNAAGFADLGQRVEAIQRMCKGLTASNHGVYQESSICFAERRVEGIVDHVVQ